MESGADADVIPTSLTLKGSKAVVYRNGCLLQGGGLLHEAASVLPILDVCWSVGGTCSIIAMRLTKGIHRQAFCP